MDLSEYPCESLSFTGLGASGETPQEASAALAEALTAWAAAHAGQRVLQVTALHVPAPAASGLAALVIHTAGPDLPGELAEQVAAAVEDAMEAAGIDELDDPVRQESTPDVPRVSGGS